jgi:acid phosphatase (class A)
MSFALPRLAAVLALSAGATLVHAADGAAPPKNSASDYVSPHEISLVRMLPNQTADNSPETRAELDRMLAIQDKRTRSDCAASLEDQDIGPARFAAMLGFPHGMPDAGLDTFNNVIDRASKFEIAVVNEAKVAFGRPRPFVNDPKLAPCIDRPNNESYPSGHAAWSYMTAYILANMFPERKLALMDRAEEFAWHRVVGGVHYPSDIAAGRKSGKILADTLFASSEFRADVKAAKKEMEAARKKGMN